MALTYQSGFWNHFESEALASALPKGQNNPQTAPFGLYAEQLSGSAFTVARNENLRSWLYRIRPSVLHNPFEKLNHQLVKTGPSTEPVNPNQLRWDPLPFPAQTRDFIDGLVTWAVNGDAAAQAGCGVHLYACNAPMTDRFMYNADGELLIVPQEGRLLLKTELGVIECAPTEIAVIPRGVKFQVQLPDQKARGYICENYGQPLRLPNLGPIGANGLANPRDFQTPVAAYEERAGKFKLVAKFHGALWQTDVEHSPLDVVAWHGNYAPYKYDLKLFNTINTVSFDHPDPSIFTVLTSPTEHYGLANVDFVIFPPRWMVAEKTFRPPYYHRNVMSEFMGLIHGVYDAKEKGFVPGGSSLHNCMSAHGPEAAVFEKASDADLKPQYMAGTLAFMFESRFVFAPTAFAMNTDLLQDDYIACWKGLKPRFDAKKR